MHTVLKLGHYYTDPHSNLGQTQINKTEACIHTPKSYVLCVLLAYQVKGTYMITAW